MACKKCGKMKCSCGGMVKKPVKKAMGGMVKRAGVFPFSMMKHPGKPAGNPMPPRPERPTIPPNRGEGGMTRPGRPDGKPHGGPKRRMGGGRGMFRKG